MNYLFVSVRQQAGRGTKQKGYANEQSQTISDTSETQGETDSSEDVTSTNPSEERGSKSRSDPFDRLIKYAENAGAEEVKEILNEIDNLSADDLEISTVREISVD